MKFSDWQELFNHLFQTRKEQIEHSVVHDLQNLTTEIVRLRVLAEESDPISNRAATWNLNVAERHYGKCSELLQTRRKHTCTKRDQHSASPSLYG